ncbi:LVIVD repeat protein [Planctomycetes bacterium Poly30]|uniref:LVIVD repeat protein n=1 Tax=Saltatorellus ferox TaxID=2528018 RepID=A0A518EQ61_9BACT|nr:LVIVD repeat protein [Planctomycetes bacterium Poly30]
MSPFAPGSLRSLSMLTGTVALFVGTIAPAAAASPLPPHEDDPKIFDRRPAIQGTGFRRGAQSAERGSAAAGGLEFAAQGVRLESWLTLGDLGGANDSGNDCWGYVSPSGREYALIGTSNATVIVEVTDPANAQVIERIDGPSSLWRDVKVYRDRAYAVSEGGSGIQVINLSNVDAGVVTLENTITGQGTNATHNVVIDEVSGYLYRTGGAGNGLRIYSLANPGSPQFVGSWNSRYVHDAQVVTYTSGPYAGRQIAYCCSGFNNGSGDTGLSVLDVTNKSNIQSLSQVAYPDRRYSHQGWLSADRTRFYLGDELDERGGINTTVTRVFDVSNPSNVTFTGSFDNGVSSISHNMYERDGYLYQANYTSGLRIFDIASSPDNPEEIAFFDTAPDLTAESFNGLWSCYPNFPSGTVIGSDLERGLFVWTVDPLRVDVNTVQLETVDSAGEAVTVQIDEFTAGSLDAASAKLIVETGAGTLDVALAPTGAPGEFTASIPGYVCGTEVSWYVSALTTSGVESTYPKYAPAWPFVSYVGTALTTVREDDMQDAAGWVGGLPGDTALRGAWVLDAPIGTDAEPSSDHSEDGRRCWFTAQGQIANNSDADVDFGFTTLLTPIFDMSQLAYPTLEYYRWYSNNVGQNPPDDLFLIEISNDAGATWQTLEAIGPLGPGTSGGWIRSSVLVPEVIVPTSQMQLRFIASDTGNTNIVEAAIDDFRIIDAICGDPVGTAYCAAEPNSSGGTGEIAAEGSAFLTRNDLQLVASGLPTSQTGFFVVSSAQAFVPAVGGSQGNLCVGANTGRYLAQVGNSGTTGEIRLIVDSGAIPQPMSTVGTLPGDTWNFQCWHRDANPMPTSNFTRGYSVTFR